MIIISICILINPIIGITLPPDGCEAVFECSPQEFLNSGRKVNNEPKIFRKFAHIDEVGQLVFYLPQSQINVWVKALKQDIYNAEIRHNIDVSDDFSELTIYGYKETVYDDFNEATTILYKMNLIRILNTGDCFYECTLRDGVTDEIVWELSVDGADYESIDEIIGSHNFSSISEKSK